MIKKILLILVIVSLTRLLMSCCKIDSYDANLKYTGFEMLGIDVSKDLPQRIQDSVRRENFAIEISTRYSYERISYNKYGYNSAVAWECTDNIFFVETDPLVSLRLFVIENGDEATNLEVSEQFLISLPNDEFYTLSEFESQFLTYWSSLHLQLESTENIPKIAQFRLEANLESGEVISGITEEIKFY